MITRIRDNLYLGDSEAELDLPSIVATFDLSGWNFDLVPFNEDNSLLHNLVSNITSIIDSGIPVLVKCHGGIDRSPLVVACFLWFDAYCKDKEISGLDAYEEVKRLHPATIIHDDWMRFYLGESLVETKLRKDQDD